MWDEDGLSMAERIGHHWVSLGRFGYVSVLFHSSDQLKVWKRGLVQDAGQRRRCCDRPWPGFDMLAGREKPKQTTSPVPINGCTAFRAVILDMADQQKD